MCDDERVRDHIQQEVDRVNQNFEKHETIKRFELVPQEFTEENDMLTPTMKKSAGSSSSGSRIARIGSTRTTDRLRRDDGGAPRGSDRDWRLGTRIGHVTAVSQRS